MSQLLLFRFSQNFKGRFVRPCLTDGKSCGDISLSNIVLETFVHLINISAAVTDPIFTNLFGRIFLLKFFLTQTSRSQNFYTTFFGPLIFWTLAFWTKHFFGLKTFLTQNSFGEKILLRKCFDQKYC